MSANNPKTARATVGGAAGAQAAEGGAEVPTAVVYLRAEGVGVLLLAAAMAGATALAVGLASRGVHVGGTPPRKK